MGGVAGIVMLSSMISSHRPIIYTWSLVTAFIPIRYCAVVSSFQFTNPSTFHLNEIATKRHQLFRQHSKLSPQSFVDEVTSFLDIDDIPYRDISNEELNGILMQSNKQSKRVNEMMSLLDDNVILGVGKGMQTATTDSIQPPYSFILNLCPTTSLDTIIKQQNNATSISKSMACAAYLNSDLTKVFANRNRNTSIVHLHQDVWNRSSDIVKSRIRSKCGISLQRIYARKTFVKRITKSEYLPFLEDSHLWGATGAKYGFGLYSKADDMLVAVATFSSKRKVNRDNQTFHSFELLRFCTKLDTTVVGGITKLISAFVKEIKCTLPKNTRIDIVTSIDRDFGSSTWPNFEQVAVMDPVPMFVGYIDGLRRHAVGAGLTPLDQNIEDESSSMTTSELLRAGLPTPLTEKLDQDYLKVSPWQLTAQNGFHPVFDTGVERLVLIVDSKDDEDAKHLWDNSMPRYVQQHYSPNKGVDQMLIDIREYKNS